MKKGKLIHKQKVFSYINIHVPHTVFKSFTINKKKISAYIAEIHISFSYVYESKLSSDINLMRFKYTVDT